MKIVGFMVIRGIAVEWVEIEECKSLIKTVVIGESSMSKLHDQNVHKFGM